MRKKPMTGKDLIDFIINNNLENTKVVLVDPDSAWCLGTIDAEEIEYDEETNTVKIY